MAVTLMALIDGVEATLGAATGMTSSKSYDELTEGIPALECPRLQVHPDRGTCDPSGWGDRTTFHAGTQQAIITIYADLYARLRSQLSEDMRKTVELIDALVDVLQAQEDLPFFGVVGIKVFNWNWKRANFKYADEQYMGARFTINLRIF